MLELTEPQVWAVIAVLASMSVGMMTIVSTLFLRVLRAEIGGLRHEMTARFETVDAKLNHLDRDVNALTQHVFGAGHD